MEHEFIYGIHPIKEALVRMPAQCQKLYIKDSIAQKNVADILDLAKQARVPFVFVPEKKLEQFVGAVVHQGVVLETSGIPVQDYKVWLKNVSKENAPLVIVLDELEDPHNVGAIIRTAAAVGASAVLLPKHRQAQATGAVLKASAGTALLVPLVRIGNVNQTLRDLKEKGWWVAGLAASPDKTFWETDLSGPLAIVVGAEGDGIREKTLELCDLTLSIPMIGKVESLNASVSAALAMYEWKRQNK